MFHFVLLFHGPKLKSDLKALLDTSEEEGGSCYSLNPAFVQGGWKVARMDHASEHPNSEHANTPYEKYGLSKCSEMM